MLFSFPTPIKRFIFTNYNDNITNNLFSYCGLVDARISASEKDLPVSSYYLWNERLRITYSSAQYDTNYKKLWTWSRMLIFKLNLGKTRWYIHTVMNVTMNCSHFWDTKKKLYIRSRRFWLDAVKVANSL